MTWQKLTLSIPGDSVDVISNILTEFGALSVTCESGEGEALFEPALDTTPLWQHTQLSALFEEHVDLNAIVAALQQTQSEFIHHYQIETIIDQDWQKACKDAFPPRCFEEKLWIYPSWHEIAEPNKPHVVLDPGLAFGTGAHPTTALCLEWLARYIQPGDVVIDYGCGSGIILAIAALKLGAKAVWAVDHDPQALEATRENALRNHCADSQLHVIFPSELPAMQVDALQVDIVVANILANPLIELAPRLISLLKPISHGCKPMDKAMGSLNNLPKGKIALSGVLSHQVEAVMAAYQSQIDFLPPTYLQQDNLTGEIWARLEGVNRSGYTLELS